MCRRKDDWVARREFSPYELRIDFPSDNASPVSVVDVSAGDLQGKQRCIWLAPEPLHPVPIDHSALLGEEFYEKRFLGHAVYVNGTLLLFSLRPTPLSFEVRFRKPLGPCLQSFFFV